MQNANFRYRVSEVIAVAIAIRTLVKVSFGGFGGFGSSGRTPRRATEVGPRVGVRRKGTPTVGGEDFEQITQLAGVVLTRMATAIEPFKDRGFNQISDCMRSADSPRSPLLSRGWGWVSSIANCTGY